MGTTERALKVGVGLATCEVPPGSGRGMADQYAETLALAQLAENLGFGSFWTSEHHGVSDGYLPSQLVFLAAVAAVTRRIRLGTGVVIAPFHDPLRLAEDAAVLDQLSHGRLEVGLGIGWRDEEFRMFGVPRAERAPRLVHMVELLRKAWTGERFSSSGPAGEYRDVQVTPAPYQPGGPPILLGGFNDVAVRRAGSVGDGFVRSRGADPSEVERDVTTALEGARQAGRPTEGFEVVLLQNILLTGAVGAQRDRDMAAALAYQLGAYAAWHDDDDTPGRGFAARPIAEDRVERAAISGRPDQVVEGLSRLVKAVGERCRTHLVVRLWYPGAARDDAAALLKSFASEVLPALHERFPARSTPTYNRKERSGAV